MNVELKDSIIVFLDILGFKKLLENKSDFKNLFDVVINIKEQNTPKLTMEYYNDNNGICLKAMPIITSFSDSIVLSIPLEDIKYPFNIGNAVNVLLSLVQQLADALIFGGYIIRGGMTRGNLYHNDGVVFGKALIEAYDLESTKAKNPRILVSNKIVEDYNKSMYDECNFLLKDNMNDKEDEYYLDYLKLSFQDLQTRKRYKDTTENLIIKRKHDILEKISKEDLDQLEEDIKILKKWIYFKDYVEKAISRYENK